MPEHKIIYGFHSIKTQLKVSATDFVAVYCAESRHDPRLKALIKQLLDENIAIHYCSSERLNILSQQANHQGLVAHIKNDLQQTNSFSTYIKNQTITKDSLFLLLDGLTDPHNLGACLRVAEASGVSAVIAPKDRSVGLTPIVHKVSSGASALVPIFFVTNFVRAINALKEKGVWVYGCSEKAQQSVYQSQLNDHPCAFVLGNEGSGLRQLTETNCDYLISIPMFGQISSLNVSVSCGIVLYEWVRQAKI